MRIYGRASYVLDLYLKIFVHGLLPPLREFPVDLALPPRPAERGRDFVGVVDVESGRRRAHLERRLVRSDEESSNTEEGEDAFHLAERVPGEISVRVVLDVGEGVAPGPL